MGRQADGEHDVDGPPRLLHQEVAGAQTVLCHHGKKILFKEAALHAQEAEAAEEEGETQAMLFGMLQDQHTKQIAQMEAANKTNMDLMMERMNALITASGSRLTHQTDKENTPPTGNVKPSTGGGERVKKPRKKKRLCPHCKMFVLHKHELCYELEANKASRYPGWKSVFATPATA
jgi:hypothetical protein